MLAAVALGMLLATVPSSTVTPEQRSLIGKLERALLAPCCYQEVVATHNSEQARAMRAEIAEMVAAGRSEREILDHYKQRYGARILAEPEGAQWWIMNVVPVLMLGGGAVVVVLVLRKWRRAAQAGGVPA
ncbi:MAG: cytochrome c-type biogenesis protein CcmH [Bryobacterales bacterium]|nr:cytochrome c-type biogenesis protein CcmH [Bryobacteraceae bacterium]MDW8131240.1 cytochrome c-type biogenesis protein CcmH [Bryobacterales bacterium]